MTMLSAVVFDRLSGFATMAAAGGSVPTVPTVATDCSNVSFSGGGWDLKAVMAVENVSNNALFYR